jgi:hypothetical protein
MRLVKIREQQVGAVKYNIYEVLYNNGETHIPSSVSLDAIVSRLPFTPITDHEQFRVIVHRFAHDFTLLIKVKQRGSSFYQKIGDSYDLGE